MSSETLGLLPSPQHPLTTTSPFLYLLFPQEEQRRYSGFSSDSTAYCETLGELLSLSEPQFPPSFKQFLLSTDYVQGCVLDISVMPHLQVLKVFGEIIHAKC